MSDKEQIHNWPSKRYDFTLPLRYHLSAPQGLDAKAATASGVVIALHGYQDHALSMLRRLGWWSAHPPFQVLAINGPFPVPLWTKLGFLEAYSWYFRDSVRQLMLVDPKDTAKTLGQFIAEIGLEDTPKIIFGFSQGGYLAPYLAPHLKNLRGLITLGCGYSTEAYTNSPPVNVQAIHGDADERIPVAESEAEYAKLAELGHHGQFHKIAGLTHKVEESVEPLVRQLSEQMFRFTEGQQSKGQPKGDR